MTVLILCNKGDLVALSLFNRLKDSAHPASLVFAEDLSISGWQHFISISGKCSTEIVLPDNKIIQSHTLKTVFNRIRFLPMLHFINEGDRQYAEMEIFALFTSFLKSINAVLINPLQTCQLFQDEENELLIKHQAIEAGLPVCDYHFTSSPKWQHTVDLVPMAPQKKSASAFYKKSPHLIWENQPVLLMEPYEKILKVSIVGEDILGTFPIEYTTAIKKLPGITGSIFLDLYFAKTITGYKLAQMTRFPLFANDSVVESLANLMMQKINRTI